MSRRENLSPSPQAPIEAVSARSPPWRTAKVLAAWLAGASVVSGLARAIQIGYALTAFGAEERLSELLAIIALRTGAAQVAASACGVALAWTAHPPLDAQRSPWRAYAILPLAAPLAAAVMVAVGTAVASLGYGVAPRASWRSIGEIVTLDDALFGLGYAVTLAIALGALAMPLIPRLSALRMGLLARIVVTLLATGVIAGAVQEIFGALLPAADDMGALISPLGQ